MLYSSCDRRDDGGLGEDADDNDVNNNDDDNANNVNDHADDLYKACHSSLECQRQRQGNGRVHYKLVLVLVDIHLDWFS